MGLLFGIVAGLLYGVGAGMGALASLPLLVVAVGLAPGPSLAVALLALGIMAAIAAGDAVRARQCDTGEAAWLILGGLTAAVALSLLLARLDTNVIVAIFSAVVLLSAGLMGRAWRRRQLPVAPAALLGAPRRSLAATGSQTQDRGSIPVRIAAGLVHGLGLAAAATPLAHGFERRPAAASDALQAVGTRVFATAVIAVLAAGLQLVLAGALPGYVAGAYVLGAVAGMGLARRLMPFLSPRLATVGVGVIVLGLSILLAVRTLRLVA